MRSGTPKLLHAVCGRPILLHAIHTVAALGPVQTAVVVGDEEPQMREALEGLSVAIVRQQEPLGTGHAVLQARSLLASHDGPVLVLNGDHPLYRPTTLARVVEKFVESRADLVLLTGEFPETPPYGRILRGTDASIDRIVEESDADEAVREIREVNLGVYVARGEFFLRALEEVGNENAQGEYFLTDVVEVALRGGYRVESVSVEDWTEALGVNDRADLALAEATLRRRIAHDWMVRGVTIADPDQTYIDADCEIGEDTALEPGSVLRAATRIGSRCRISAGAVIDDSTLGDDVVIKPHCFIESSVIGSGCELGPSAHLRPAVVLEDNVRIGNFVEVKNSRIGRGTKADHLSYIGDADVGSGVTIGCGAITVNYDGKTKERTVIGDGAFVGCNANLIAPVTVEAGAYIAAGSTITKDVPEGALGVARARQRNVEQWRTRRFSQTQPPEKKK
jgi:bifunctional UDP-N-acetylglucosamine pyrophosphorylase/glucosamine-1-phosphate N-acetyltransferase